MAVVKVYPLISVGQAWINLASDVLLLAIEDARQTRDPRRRAKAQEWLLSPAAKLFFETFDFRIEIEDWVKAGCPVLDKK